MSAMACRGLGAAGAVAIAAALGAHPVRPFPALRRSLSTTGERDRECGAHDDGKRVQRFAPRRRRGCFGL